MTKLHSDQGSNFAFEIIKELCQITGTEKTRTIIYHPMGNGLTEKYNRRLLNMLGTLEAAQKKDWKKYVPSLVYASNYTKHKTTKVSSFELMFGRNPKLPIDSAFETPVESSYSSQDTKKYLEDLRDRMKTTPNIVKRYTEKAQMKQKKQFDKRSKASKIMVGDRVLVKILAFDGKHKIADRFEEDVYTVIKQPIPDIPVRDVKSDNGKELSRHRNQLLPIHEEKAVGDTEENDKHNSAGKRDHVVANQDSSEQTKDASSELDAAKIYSSKVERNVEEKEESIDSEFSDYEVIYEYVEPTCVHGDTHYMTGVKESVETDTEERVEAVEGPDEEVETEEVEELDQEIVTEVDLNKDGSSEVPEKCSSSRKDSEKGDTHVKKPSHKSDQSPISEDEGEETAVKEINAGNIDKKCRESGQVGTEARPKEKTK